MPRKKKTRQKIKWCFDFPKKYLFKTAVIAKSKVKIKWTFRTT